MDEMPTAYQQLCKAQANHTRERIADIKAEKTKTITILQKRSAHSPNRMKQ
jgi:PHD/YefM family antitoxin component YafN of YafNO toxin-antitoxin module